LARGTWTNTYAYGPSSLTLTNYYVSGFAETGTDATGDPNGFSAELVDKLPPIDPADYAGFNYNPTYAPINSASCRRRWSTLRNLFPSFRSFDSIHQ
jgi:hypothetical protein